MDRTPNVPGRSPGYVIAGLPRLSGPTTTVISPNIRGTYTPMVLPLNINLSRAGSRGVTGPIQTTGFFPPAAPIPIPSGFTAPSTGFTQFIQLTPGNIGPNPTSSSRSTGPTNLGRIGSIPIASSSIQPVAPVAPLPIELTKEEEDIPTTCPLCLCDYGTDESDETPVKLACGHYFGNDCIKCVRNPNCPTCRAPITGMGTELQQTLQINQLESQQTLILKDKIVNEANGFFMSNYADLVEIAEQNGAVPLYEEINDQLIQQILSALNPNQLIEIIADYDTEIYYSHPFQILCYNLWEIYDHALGLNQAEPLKQLGAHILADPFMFQQAVTQNLLNNLLYITVRDMLMAFVMETREKYGKEALVKLL